MADKGLSSSDFSNQARINTLTRSPNGNGNAPPDPLDVVLADSRKIAAARISQSNASSLEVEALKAETEMLKAQVENRHAREEAGVTTAKGSGDVWLTWLMERLSEAERTNRALTAETMAQQREAMGERIAMLSEEIARAKANVAPPANDMETTLRTVQAAKDLVSTLSPPPAVIVPSSDVDSGFEKYKITVEAQREERRLQFEMDRWLKQEELTLRREEMAREQARMDQSAQVQERALADTLPKILGLLEQGVQIFIQRSQTTIAATAAAPAVAPDVAPPAPRPLANLPPGYQANGCPTCGARILYRPEAKEIICYSCGTVLHNTEEETPNGVASDSSDPGAA